MDSLQAGSGSVPAREARSGPARVARSGMVAVVSASLVLSSLTGCVTTQSQRIGSDDGTDACRAYVVALDSTGNYFAEDMLKGAAIGAIGGALIGGLVSGSWKGAAIGAAGGALVGGLGGYWKSKQDQKKDQAVPSFVSDMKQDSQQIDKTQAAFRNLTACRRAEAKKIRGDYAAGAIAREEAQSRLRRLATQARKDVDILNAITGNADKRLIEYQYAANQIDPNVPPPKATTTAVTTTTTPPKHHRVPGATAATQQFHSLQAKESSLKQNASSYANESSGWENAKLG